jgi:dCMP deaminase
VTRLSLEDYALELAHTASARSEDPFFAVGACLVRHDKTVAALGYNGAPPGVDIDWADRDARRVWVVHAEANALRYVRPGEIAFAAVTALPCAVCMVQIVAYGIKRVVYRDDLDPATYDTTQILRIAEGCGIEVQKV